MDELQTLHTTIERGAIAFNSPQSYDIIQKNSGKIVNTIDIQKGAILDCGLNGVLMEELLLICIDQLEHFQASEFKCRENEDTLRHLYDALHSTRSRQYSRSLRGVQGRNKK